MLRPLSAAVCLTSALVSGAVARPTEAPVKWMPAGKWVVDFADQQCTAGREFRSGQTLINLNFRPRPTTDGVTIAIEMPRAGRTLGIFRAKVDFGQRMADSDSLSAWPSTKPGYVIYGLGTNREGLAKLASSQQLKVVSSQLQIDLSVAGLPEVMHVVDRCVADLLTHWGLSVQDQARMVSFPVSVREIGYYVSNGDYPSTALSRKAIGIVEARVTVSPEGKPSDCQLVRSSGHDDLDKITCKVIVDRARFHPAKDREGRAMASPYAFAIKWVIPN